MEVVLWDTFDKQPQERKLLNKLDAALLTYASLGRSSTYTDRRSLNGLGFFIKLLDSVNISSAFVSGMRVPSCRASAFG